MGRMKAPRLVVGLLVVALGSSCASTPPTPSCEEQLNSWVGESAAQLAQRLGSPSETRSLGGGHTSLFWSRDAIRLEQEPASQFPGMLLGRHQIPGSLGRHESITADGGPVAIRSRTSLDEKGVTGRVVETEELIVVTDGDGMIEAWTGTCPWSNVVVMPAVPEK